MRAIVAAILFSTAVATVQAQDTVRYVDNTLSNIDYHHGQLTPAVGVHNIQTFRANREHSDWAGGMNWTYNHQSMICYWNNTFYMHFLSNPVGEHIAPGKTFIQSSKDGYNWSNVQVLFPEYRIPDGFKKAEGNLVAKNIDAVMHQRVGFYVAGNGKLLAQGYYGIALDAKDDPNDGNGIGRVVREINKDGSFGPVYFIRYNHGFNEKNTSLPFYKKSKDKAFIAACDELMSKPLQMQQWVEEADRDDVLIPLKKQFKAFSYYHLPDGRVAGFWKYALTSISNNEGKTWAYNPTRAPGFVNANAKIWGQRTSDGKYATVYNPSEFRWPLALSVSDDGLNYKNLLLVNGEITSMRYGGNYKSYGPQYIRGIQEGEGTPPGGNMWLTYSVNKEDIWVASVPVPVTSVVKENIAEDFAALPATDALKYWNIYSPVWATVGIAQWNGKQVLTLKDADPFDYAKAERVVPESVISRIEFSVIPRQKDFGRLDIEFQDAKNTPAIRFSFDSTGNIITKAGYRDKGLAKYEAGKAYHFVVELNTKTRFYTVSINGSNPNNNLVFAPIAALHHVSFRTGGVRRFPTADTPTDQVYDLPDAGEKDKEAVYGIPFFKATKQ